MSRVNVMWYTGKFDEATWHLLALIGLTPAYLREQQRGMVAVQQETTYKRELLAGDLIAIHSGVLEMREKVVRFYHEMLNAETRELAAKTTLTGVHLDTESRKSCPFPKEILKRGRQLVTQTGQGLTMPKQNRVIPRLYPILDAGFFANANAMLAAAQGLVVAGCTLLQYRNKSGNARLMLEQARELKRALRGQRQNPHFQNHGEVGHPHSDGVDISVRLIMNDRADLCLAAEFDGVHVGQDDLSAEAARSIIGPGRWLGVSTHNPEQLREADLTSADYLAIGPVFATASKEKPDPVVGLEGVRRARSLTRKPLVAIGGITRANAASVIEAGADSVAVISDLSRDPQKSAEEFFRILG